LLPAHLLKFFAGISLFIFLGFAALCYFSPKFFIKTAYMLVKLELSDIPEISSTTLSQVMESSTPTIPRNFILVDIRTPQERDVSIIPGAVDDQTFERHLADHQHKKIIVYCTIGYRSGFYARTLRDKGLNAYNLSEGILGWTHADGRLLDSHGHSTRQVHVYSRPWHLAVKDDYMAVY
jgi:rhodanese-related sulfurtransferase